MKPLVSIITPCYNGELFVGRYLDSVLAQTYPNIEMIIINDGSTDGTDEIILSYKERFEEKGYTFIYLKQENGGQSAAINYGLKFFTGDYLTWPDSDDLLVPESIVKKVDYMERHPDKGIVICRTSVVSENAEKQITVYSRKKTNGNDNLFEDLILDNNVYYSPGGYFVRSSMFRDSMPNPIKIATPREIGQNFQLLLPIAYKYPCGYIDDVLYVYMVRGDSHSHSSQSILKKQHAIDVSIKVIGDVCSRLSVKIDDKIYFQRLLEIRYAKANLKLLAEYDLKENVNKYIQKLKDNNAYNLDMRLLVLSIDSIFWKRLIILKNKIFN